MGSIYEYAINLPECERLYITEIDASFNCDTYFPEVPEGFVKVSESEKIEENNTTFRFVIYERS